MLFAERLMRCCVCEMTYFEMFGWATVCILLFELFGSQFC